MLDQSALRRMQQSQLTSSSSFHPRLYPTAAAAAAAGASVQVASIIQKRVKRATVTGFVAWLMRNINSARAFRTCEDSPTVDPP